MEEDEEKREDFEDSVILLPSPFSPQPVDVDVRKGRPKEENWSYLIALLIPVSILIIIMLFVILR